MVTDYNAIAHTYREAKSLPIKQYSEAFTFFQVFGALDGLVALDVACGDGYYLTHPHIVVLEAQKGGSLC